MSLFDITNDYLSVLNNFDEETGEIDLSGLDNIDAAFDDKAVAVASFIKNLESQSSAIKEAMDNMASRRKTLDNKVSRLSDYLLSSMQAVGKTEISTSPYFKIKVKNNPAKVEIKDENLLPALYVKSEIVRKVDKAALKKALSEGIICSGAELVKGVRLDIK